MEYILSERQLNILFNDIKLLNEQSFIPDKPKGCDEFKNTSSKKLCKKLNSSSYRHITTPVIMSVFNSHKKKWEEGIDEESKNKTIEVLNKLKSIDPNKVWRWANPNPKIKIPQQGIIDDFIQERLPKLSFIYSDGKWDQINKLDTNYSDTAILFTDIILKNYGEEYVKEVYNSLEDNDTTKLEEISQKIQNGDIKIFDEIKYNKERYIQNSTHNSYEGELIEGIVLDFLLTKGFTLIHRGGGGDPIDVLLGIDLIMEKDGKIYTFQCKKVFDISFEKSTIMNPEKGAYQILSNKNLYISKQPNLDYVAYGTLNGSILITKKQYDILKNKEGIGYIYLDKETFAQPKREKGYSLYKKGHRAFYVDVDSVIFKTNDI